MKKQKLLKILNPILLVLMINQLASGFLGHSMSHEAFEMLHKNGGKILAAAVLLHLILNWNWVKATYLKR